MAHDREKWQALVKMVIKYQVPQNAGNFLTSWRTISFSRRILLHGVRWLVVAKSNEVAVSCYSCKFCYFTNYCTDAQTLATFPHKISVRYDIIYPMLQ